MTSSLTYNLKQYEEKLPAGAEEFARIFRGNGDGVQNKKGAREFYENASPQLQKYIKETDYAWMVQCIRFGGF